MPALLVHLTAAREATERACPTSPLAQASQRQLSAFLLGSVLPDLPYHARFGRQVLHHLLQKAYLISEWGDLWHTRATGQLALGLLSHLRRAHLRPLATEQVLALTAGYLTHHALDRVIHPLINQLVDRESDGSLPPVVLHSRLEHYQNVLYHQDRLGAEITGAPYPRKITAKISGARLLKPQLPWPLWQALRATCLEVHGRIPQKRQLQDWLWGIAAYGQLMSSPGGRLERLSQSLQEVRDTYYEGPDVNLKQGLDRAIDLSVSYWQAAEEVLAAEQLTQEARAIFLHKVPDVDLATGW